MPSIPFSNTEIAFKHKSTSALKKARLLFNSFNYPVLIKYGPGLAAAMIGILPPIRTLIKNTLFAQFCGGENIADCKKTIAELSANHIGTILDYSVEGEETETVFEETCAEIIATILKAATDRQNLPFSVFKITGIGRIDLLTKVNAHLALSESERTEFERIKNRFSMICRSASDNDVKLFVDAEDSWIQDVIDDLTYEAMLLYNREKAIIFNTIQCYRTGRVEHIRHQLKTLNCFLGFKVVRGAYMEKERERAEKMNYTSPIHISKADTDLEYNQALELCIDNIDRICLCAGTHNEESSQFLADLMEKRKINASHPHIFFAQLLGMSDHISFNLAKSGYNVAKYVPYGPVKAVLPYLSRRARENSSVQGQVGRELSLIDQELKRRKA